MGKTNLKKIKVAITGNIGSGKSTFTKFLSEKYYPVIYADEISKKLLSSDLGIRKKVIEEFGAKSYSEEGVNNKYLADKVFSDSKLLKKINTILHPAVRTQIESLSKDFFKTNNIIFVEAALIYESKIEKMFDLVVLIITDEELRLKRTIQMNKLSKQDFFNRNKSQIDDTSKIKKADFVFINNGSIDELKAKANLLTKLLESHPG